MTQLRRSEEILDWMGQNPGVVIIWSDEKLWDVDSHKNRQNHRFIARCKEDVPPKWATKHPAAAMQLGVVGSDGNKMDPFLFDPKRSIDQDYYLEVMETTVLPWIKSNYTDHILFNLLENILMRILKMFL